MKSNDNKDGTLDACAQSGCGHVCCEFQQGNYILCYPSELEKAQLNENSTSHLEVVSEDRFGGTKVVCRAHDTSTCDNGYKPLDCASYPFFPTEIGDNDKLIKGRKCPLSLAGLESHKAWVTETWNDLAARQPELKEWVREAEMVGYDPISSIKEPKTDAVLPKVNRRLIAICGIDGAGKSTLVDMVSEQSKNPHIAPLRKSDRSNMDLTSSGEFINPTSFEEILNGPTASLIRYAHSFDFLNLYLTEYINLRKINSYIIADRWFPCAIAYAATGTSLGDEIASLLKSLDTPGLTIYLRVSPKTARHRVEQRGNAAADEHLGVLEEFERAYSQFFSTFNGHTVQIDAEDLDKALIEANTVIKDYVQNSSYATNS